MTYWESRIVPISTTWGSLFRDIDNQSNLYFVFGTNEFDYRFLNNDDKRCRTVASINNSSTYRSLLAHTPQMDLENKVTEYSCRIFSHEHKYPTNDHNEMVRILWMGNCTGEYFGIGPVCRCQEAMRYFYNNLMHSHEW